MNTEAFFDPATYTLSYVVYDAATRDAVIIDPVLDYSAAGSEITYASAHKLIEFVRTLELKPHFILETHAHADHLSSAQVLKKVFPDIVLAVGERIVEVQKAFKPIFDLPENFPTDGSQFDRLLGDNEELSAGSLPFKVISTPGHTPACCSYLFGDTLFVGDAIFIPDLGTGRCDFPAGSAPALYKSITERIYTLPDETRIFVGHDYLPGGRELKFETTVLEEKHENAHLNADLSEEQFVKFRSERDSTLNAPGLLFQSVQVNINGGRLPAPSDNEKRYFHIPLQVVDPDFSVATKDD